MSEFDIVKNIQSRTEERYSVIDHLTIATPLSRFSLNFDGSLEWRKIDRETRYKSLSNITQSSFDTEIEELKMNFNSYIRYNSQNFNSILKILVTQREEKHRAKPLAGADEIIFEDRNKQEQRKNNSGTQITLSSENVFTLSEKDQMLVSLFHRKFKYDTPSELNFDDRDELLQCLILNIKENYLRSLISLQVSTEATAELFTSLRNAVQTIIPCVY
jgi:hypothetical protein